MTTTTASTFQYGFFRRAVLAVATALIGRPEDSARKDEHAADTNGTRPHRDLRVEAELRRDAAIAERLLLPRQF